LQDHKDYFLINERKNSTTGSLTLFLKIETTSFGLNIHDDEFLLKVAFQANFLEKLNILNKTLQGHFKIIITTTNLKSFE